MAKRASKPVEFPHDKGVPGVEVIEDGGELWPVLSCSGRDLGEHPLATGGGERVDLEGGVLVASGGAGVAEHRRHGWAP